MKSKFWKLFILIAFVATLITMAIWMYKNYTLKSPYYQENEQESEY